MGNVVSLVHFQHSTPALDDAQTLPAAPRPSPAPSHINLIPPQALCAFVPSPLPPPDSPTSSPPLPFYTAPSTPLTSPQQEDPPQDTHLAASAAPPSPPPTHPRLQPSSCDIETIPPADALVASDLALDFTLDDEGLSTLEKIYLFSRSRSAHHRVFISHALSAFLASVTPHEAAEYVLPLLPSLAMDEDETVKEAFASELVEILWWFLTHCLLVEEPPDPGIVPLSRQQDGNDLTSISVQAFTPILGTLLLSPNGMVSGPARCAVVDLLCRIRNADDAEESAQPSHTSHPLFGRIQRQMFEEELIHQLVIGIGRLDASVEDEDIAEIWYDATARTPAGDISEGPHSTSSFLASDQPSVNPYFPHPSSHQSPTSSPVATTSGGFLSPPLSVPSVPADSRAFVSRSFTHGMLPTAEDADLPNGMPQSDHRSTRQEGGEADEDLDPGEQAAVGRLSSMSLIAAVAADGSLRLDAKRAFVREVERTGKDPVHWVRREASFALGALAKVIPEELVVFRCFETLRKDTIWHVRHSSLFALPAVLSRLTPALRRSVALSTIVPLSRDESPAVRSGVLEALGEVLYSFHADEYGPPDELLSLFLGRQENHPNLRTMAPPVPLSFAPSKLDLFYDDPVRPLACAFNYPAVALTLGRARWGELRSLYLTLSQNRSTKVRKTLTASLGELAKVIGPENARRDLVDVWWDAMRCTEDGDIRLKAIEALPLLINALGEGEARDSIFSGLIKIWEEGWLRNWRAREGIIKIIPDLAGAPACPEYVHQILKWGLEDDFGAVREVSISVVMCMQREDGPWRSVLDRLRRDILQLAYASSFRKRMTYVACQQALASCSQVDNYLEDRSNWQALEQLASDGIVGVRIGVARLAGCLFGLFTICNAVTCSIAVWNFSLVRFTQALQLDVYLIFLSAFSLLSIFTLVFVELLCINAVTTRVWFEFAWVALFWVMELAGGAALIAINSSIPCSTQGTLLREAVCTSERVLLAFIWMCNIMRQPYHSSGPSDSLTWIVVFIYLLALVFLIMSRHHEGTTIWVTDVRTLRVTVLRQYPPLPSTPKSPLTPALKKRASIDIYTPQPVRSYPVQTFYRRGGLSSEYEIEPFRPVLAGPEQMDIPHASNLPEATPLPPLAVAPIIPPLFMKPMPALPKDTGNVHSLMRSQFDPPQTLVSSIAYSSSAGPPPVPSKSSSLPSPPPLGDWPRQDVMQLPVKPKHMRQSPPPSAFEFPNRYMVTTERASVPTDTVTQPRPRRPSGPRLRVPSVESVHRPAPLDLSGISNYEIGRC
ncbi:armadillo-type protein [Butyriboletus roseoflavus]|nr:armadillo-type protein [Butyriboletus roseoflavus]